MINAFFHYMFKIFVCGSFCFPRMTRFRPGPRRKADMRKNTILLLFIYINEKKQVVVMSTNTGIFNLSADNPQPLMHQWFQHHSTYDPVTYRLLFGDVSAKLESLRTASYADIAKQSEEKKDSVKEDPEVQCYSLFWYWQRTGMYRDIVHQFIKPRHSYSAYAHHSVYQHVATPVHFVVCESDETFHFLLNYTEVELGPDAM